MRQQVHVEDSAEEYLLCPGRPVDRELIVEYIPKSDADNMYMQRNPYHARRVDSEDNRAKCWHKLGLSNQREEHLMDLDSNFEDM
jgi:hypothetical protein